jgi:flagellum-specific ATP synthase
MDLLGAYFTRLRQHSPYRWRGRVTEATGQTIESEGPPCSVGECCEIRDSMGKVHSAEVIGFRGTGVLSMTLGAAAGIRYGDPISGPGAECHWPAAGRRA